MLTAGLAQALMYAPSVTLLGYYFHNRRSFAMAVANTGVSVSSLIFAPLTQYLITSFGTRGAILLVAGIQMQAVVAACLLRPVSAYTRKKRPSGEAGQSGELQSDGMADHDEHESPGELQSPVKTNAASINGMEERSCLELKEITTKLLDDFERTEVDLCDTRKILSGRYNGNSLLSSSLPEKSFLSNAPVRYFSEEVLHSQNQSLNMVLSRNSARHHACSTDHKEQSPNQRQALEWHGRPCVYSTSLVDVCRASSVNVTRDTFPLSSSSHLSPDHSQTDDESSDGRGCCRRCLSSMSAIVDVSMFKNWLFLLIIAYVPLGLSAGFIGFYFPSLGVSD